MGEKSKILFIDDEPDLCLLVKGNLEETKEFDVITSTDPLQVEALCQREKPDLLLLDNIMPARKGSDIVKALKKNEETKQIPVIMISGKGEMVFSKKKGQFQWLPNNPAVRDRGDIVVGKDPEELSKAYGVDDYISKPFTTELLIQVIKDVLKKAMKKKVEEE